MSRGLWYGQIRNTNYLALREVYGYEPPWPMGRSPHVDLVQALRDGRDPSKTAFADYLRLTGRPDLLLERVDVIRGLMASEGPFQADICCDCVLDGNHRVAVSLVRGQPLFRNVRPPYQTIVTPWDTIDGRRLDDRWPIDYDFTGKVVVDLGARDGMNSVRAMQAGARKAILIDHDYTSLTWQVLDAWKLRGQCEVRIEDILDTKPMGDVVLAFSVHQHIGEDCLEYLTAGKDVILETHTDCQPPSTGHKWRYLKSVAYSRELQHLKRNLYHGTWA